MHSSIVILSKAIMFIGSSYGLQCRGRQRLCRGSQGPCLKKVFDTTLQSWPGESKLGKGFNLLAFWFSSCCHACGSLWSEQSKKLVSRFHWLLFFLSWSQCFVTWCPLTLMCYRRRPRPFAWWRPRSPNHGPVGGATAQHLRCPQMLHAPEGSL